MPVHFLTTHLLKVWTSMSTQYMADTHSMGTPTMQCLSATTYYLWQLPAIFTEKGIRTIPIYALTLIIHSATSNT